jgi:hypothetical protein
VFRGHGIPFSQRCVTKSRCCFLQAPVMLAAMKAYISNPTNHDGKLPIVDMTKYVNHKGSFDSAQFTQIFIDNDGGHSLDHLNALLPQTDSQTLSVGTKNLYKPLGQNSGKLSDDSDFVRIDSDSPCKLIALLKKHGPALVHWYRMDPRLVELSEALPVDLSEPPFVSGSYESGRSDPHHAMLLVGARLVDNEWRVLLQNWWPNMPFVELSSEYFACSNAALTFLVNRQGISIPEQFELCTAPFAQSELDGIDMDTAYSCCCCDDELCG